MKKKYILTFLLITIINGCGQKPSLTPETQPGVYYQTAWIDPQVVISDSLFTLFRASRIDSFQVEQPEIESIYEPSISFQINLYDCPVVVNILDEKSAGVVLPLLVKNLSPGYYKLSLDFSRMAYRALPPGYYILKVETCDIPQMKLFIRE